jgi:transposase
MRTINLSISETEKLNYERYYYPCPIVQKRIHAVYLKAKLLLSDQEIGLIVDLHRNAVASWTKTYLNSGFDALCKVEYCNKNKSQLELFSDSIVSSFEQNPPFKVNEAMSRIEKMTGIKRGLSQIRSFLRRNGFRCRKMGHIPAKADPQKQHDYVDNTLTPVIEKAEKNECHLLFMDASHFILQPFICRVWSKVRLFIKASAGRNRINVLGAVNAISKEVSTLINQTYITAETIVTFLHQLKEQYRDAPIFIVLDNARYQHCNLVQKTAESLDITLLFLPPYSPNLNIIERLWKFTKGEILNGKYYDCPQKFHQAIKSFFEIVNQKYQTELLSLLTLKFQFFEEKNALNLAA